MKIITGKKSRPRRIILYGPHGIGKSTWAASATKPIFLSTEDGLDDIGCDRTPLIEDLGTFGTYLLELGSDTSGYRTVVVDSVDWLERLVWSQVAKENNKKSIDEIPYYRGYQLAIKHWDDILLKLAGLRIRKSLSVVLVAHARSAKVEPPDGEAYNRYEPDLHKTVAPLLQEWADEVLFCGYKVHQVSKGEGFDQRHIAIGGERTCYTSEKPTHLAKRRIDMPDEIPLVWADYAGYVRASYATHDKPDGNINGVVVGGSSKPKTETPDNG